MTLTSSNSKFSHEMKNSRRIFHFETEGPVENTHYLLDSDLKQVMLGVVHFSSSSMACCTCKAMARLTDETFHSKRDKVGQAMKRRLCRCLRTNFKLSPPKLSLLFEYLGERVHLSTFFSRTSSRIGSRAELFQQVDSANTTSDCSAPPLLFDHQQRQSGHAHSCKCKFFAAFGLSQFCNLLREGRVSLEYHQHQQAWESGILANFAADIWMNFN